MFNIHHDTIEIINELKDLYDSVLAPYIFFTSSYVFFSNTRMFSLLRKHKKKYNKNKYFALMHFSRFKQIISLPKMWHTASITLVFKTPSALFFFRFSDITQLDTTGQSRFMNWSKTFKHDFILWGNVPPTTDSLVPLFSKNIPTSPIRPHCIANAVK